MKYELVVISDFLNLKGFESTLNKGFPNLNISLFSNLEELIPHSNFIDILIVHVNLIDKIESIQSTFKSDPFIFFVIDDNFDLSKINKKKKYNILYRPLKPKKIVQQIRSCIKNIENRKNIDIKDNIFNAIVQDLNSPIFSIDKNNNFIFANNYFLKITQTLSIKELNKKYKNSNGLLINEPDCIDDINSIILNKYSDLNNKVCIKVGNEKRFYSTQSIYFEKLNSSFLVLNDVSEEVFQKQELNKLLFTENLTKLPNRIKLIDELQNKALNPKAVALLNINAFKEVNDFYGHKVGDYILINVGRFIEKIVSKQADLKLYKFPSDNYCIVNFNSLKSDFVNIIEDILKQIDDFVFVYENYEIDIRVSAGISLSDKNNKLITADIALQTAKKDNKDFVVFYDELDKFQEYENNMLWTKKLKSAFINDNIEVFFQPLINNSTLKVDKYECLVRLIDEDGKVVNPFFFLDISKKSNQYTKLTKIVIEKSFRKFENLPFEFSVNISYEDIENEDFLDFIKEMLAKYKVNNRVIFEILEDESIKNYNHLLAFIDEVKNLGCKIAIDDFGSGYSNFEYLLKMNADYLKIDASIIKNIAKDENSYKITKTIIEFAKSLNLKTIAEYVENKEIFEMVRDLGADYSQGYFFSAPISEPTLKEFDLD